MNILICAVVLCAFIILLNAFSKKYIQFVYNRLYVKPRESIDKVLEYGEIPEQWKNYSKEKKIRKLKKMVKFVKRDRLTPDARKEDQIDILNDVISDMT